MGVKRPLPSMVIKYEGICDWDAIYSFIINWFFDHGYSMVNESEYKHKSGGEEEITIDAEKKMSGLIMYTMSIKIHLWGLKDVEVTVKGKKKKLSQLRIRMEIKPTMIIDYRNRFKGSKFLEKIFNFYINTIRKREIELIEDDLYYEMVHLHDGIKKLFDMQSKWGAY